MSEGDGCAATVYIYKGKVHVYTENLLHVLNLLEISAQSGTLSLTPTIDRENSSWQATGVLREGKVSELKLRRTADGNILLGGVAALEWLKAQGGLYWQFKELPPDTPPFSQTIPTEEIITQKTPIVHPYVLKRGPVLGPEGVPKRTFLGECLGVQGVPSHMWSREHRTAFLLIDGTRNKAEILRLLPVSFDKLIDTILSDLKSAGLIE